jgi:LPS-assembly protein
MQPRSLHLAAVCDTVARIWTADTRLTLLALPALARSQAKKRIFCLLGCAALWPIFSFPALAQANLEACPNPALAPVIASPPDRSQAPITIMADRLDAGSTTMGSATGRVELFRADQYLATDVVHYHPNTGMVSLPSPMLYQDSQLRLEAGSGMFGMNEESGDFRDVDFSFVGSSAHGEAELVQLQGGSRSILTRPWFTTCPGENPAWRISASELELRHDEGVGVARGARLQLGRVPVLYAPYFTFPINDQRKSGFLYPFLSTANDNGLEVGIPWYWNIAPNQDATLTPRYFTDRGFMGSGEYRLLTERTRSMVEAHYLVDDSKTNEDRWHTIVRANASFNPRWQGNARLERVSDDEYFQDFGGDLASTSRQFLRSEASIDGAGRYWILSLLVDNFQVLDDAVNSSQEPYQRLPRLGFMLDAPLGNSGLQTTVDSEFVYFDRNNGVTGARLDLFPSLVWDLSQYWGFLRASGGYRYTAYDLDLQGEEGNSSPDRGLPIFSLDSGMYFQRELQSGNTQTLEPRLFYLYVPFEDQSNLPDFDTGEFTFGYAQLFHTNRFTGADRQTDANQLTLAASTRSIDADSGREAWSFNVGQILYLQSPRVALDEPPESDPDTSPLLAEFNWHPIDRFRTRLGIEWSWEQREMNVGVAALDYLADGGSRLGFEYRYRRDRLDQFDVRYLWPINEKWRLFTRVNYSVQDSELLEGLVGIEYESCCWALRVAARRYLRDRNGGQRDSVFVELRLIGLGAFGRREPPLFHTPAP